MTERSAIQIVTPAAAEQADYAVCCRAGMFSPFIDNQTGSCAACGHAIFFRPTLPKTPTKICIKRAADLAGSRQ